MNSFRLKSVNSDTTLEFTAIDSDYFCASLIGRDHTAVRRVFGYTDAPRITHMFGEAAAHWKGWEGRKSWNSPEGDLALHLTCDQSGHVVLSVLIRTEPGEPDGWQHHAELALEVGQLDGVVRGLGGVWPDGG
ncbi:MAG: DUF6228 family protein [Gemmatimonadaceae bacterium]